MRIIIISFTVIICFILETSLFQFLRIFGIKPDFMLMVVTAYSLLRGSSYGAAIGLAFGLLTDVFFGRVIGINAISYMVVGYFMGRWSDRLFLDSNYTSTVFNFFSVLMFQNIFFLLSLAVGIKVGYIYFVINIMLPQCIYNALAGIFIYRLIYKIDHSKLAEKRLI